MKAAPWIGVPLFLLFSTASQAVERQHQSTLKFVYPLANGDFVLGFDVDAPQCSAPSPKYMYAAVGQNGMTAEGAKKLYAAALTGFAAGRLVSIAYDDSSAYCYINRLSVHIQ